MRLSKNFLLSELVVSKQYPHLLEEPTTFIISILQFWCRVFLQPIRNRLKEKIYISSGWRPKRLNAKVSKEPRSIHQIELVASELEREFLGVATDNYFGSEDILERFILEALESYTEFSTLIIYPKRYFVHGDHRVAAPGVRHVLVSIEMGKYEVVDTQLLLEVNRKGHHLIKDFALYTPSLLLR